MCARSDHGAVSRWGPRAWAACPHVRVRTSSGGESPVDLAARAQKLSRASPYLPRFLLAPPAIWSRRSSSSLTAADGAEARAVSW